ncbi:MAG: glycosyltransferase, partial [Solirubrobacterales bacterium]
MPDSPDTKPARQTSATVIRTRMGLRRFAGGQLADLPRRALLTYRWHGRRETALRLALFPLRFTPAGRRWTLARGVGNEAARAMAWYRQHAKPVTVVIPTYGDPSLVRAAVRSVRRTTDRKRVRIVVCDDGSPEDVRRRLRRLRGAELIEGQHTLGFAANTNRGLREAEGDVVIMNSDIVAGRGWLECLQYAAHQRDDTGIVGPKLTYPDGTIQSAGSYRNLGAPEWFDHRYRFKPGHYGPANVARRVLGVTGACMYVRAELREQIGDLDEAYGMGFEDMDYCLRAWDAGFEILYYPPSMLTHHESKTRGSAQGERELASQQLFWKRWGAWLDDRPVGTPEGGLRVIYVTEDTGVGGGHRDIFEHINQLRERGHDAQLWSLGVQPDWFELDVAVRTFDDYDELADELADEDAIKVATWWNTATAVWKGSVRRGIPVFFVQDFETSYYPDNPLMQREVVANYREEFRYMTISSWNRDRLRELGLDAELVPPGIDLDTFRPLDDVEGRGDVVLAIGRTNPLKNLPLTIESWRAMGSGPELWMFGIEPELGERHGARYIESPTDDEVNELINTAGAFVQTSVHEGFCLPPLEAMAAGTPVVCTDAHG